MASDGMLLVLNLRKINLFVHLMIGTSEALLWTRRWTFLFHINISTSWVPEILLGS